MRTHYVPGTVLVTKDVSVYNTEENPCFWELSFRGAMDQTEWRKVKMLWREKNESKGGDLIVTFCQDAVNM